MTVLLAVGAGFGALAVWAVLLVRVLLAFISGREKRPYILAMPSVGFLASIGALASALAYASGRGFNLGIDPATLSLIASMGRGALFMGGLIALGYYHPGRQEGP